jgi:hypothetical protein
MILETREKMNKEELKNITRHVFNFYDKNNVNCNWTDMNEACGEILKILEQETVSRESYDHEYFLRNKFEVKAWKLEKIIEDLKQDTLDDAREDFMFDVYKILDFLPTNNEANQIIDVFDRVTSGLKLSKDCALDKIKAKIEALPKTYPFTNHFDTYVKEDDVRRIIDKYREEK